MKRETTNINKNKIIFPLPPTESNVSFLGIYF